MYQMHPHLEMAYMEKRKKLRPFKARLWWNQPELTLTVHTEHIGKTTVVETCRVRFGSFVPPALSMIVVGTLPR